MVLLRCPNKKCKHKWNYTGKRKINVCCPNCGNRVYLISKNIISDWPKRNTGYIKNKK